ncbi:MAG: hypothetical protein Ta2E_11590 [Mycoplasmoidaceae bacterium]|nr:MAG: hypothetical protein Ta2E_11590 [Mycoplasmoidaceae bacterium]
MLFPGISNLIWYVSLPELYDIIFIIDPQVAQLEPIVLASLTIFVSLQFICMSSERLTVLRDQSAALKLICLPSQSVIV